MTPGEKQFDGMFVEAIKKTSEKIIAEEINKAKIEIERRIKEETASIAISLVRYATVERFGQDLRITIQFPENQ